mmetsp:Transcript_91041/g.166895  ORF Transcript_91041/g.166895 Transcript_91041/m.166895 type:complete len:309 (+) Transcript_91041:250-1176(+)
MQSWCLTHLPSCVDHMAWNLRSFFAGSQLLLSVTSTSGSLQMGEPLCASKAPLGRLVAARAFVLADVAEDAADSEVAPLASPDEAASPLSMWHFTSVKTPSGTISFRRSSFECAQFMRLMAEYSETALLKSFLNSTLTPSWPSARRRILSQFRLSGAVTSTPLPCSSQRRYVPSSSSGSMVMDGSSAFRATEAGKGKLTPTFCSSFARPGCSGFTRMSLAPGKRLHTCSNSFLTVGTVTPHPNSMQARRIDLASGLACSVFSHPSYRLICSARRVLQKMLSPPNICTHGLAIAWHFGHLGSSPFTRHV